MTRDPPLSSAGDRSRNKPNLKAADISAALRDRLETLCQVLLPGGRIVGPSYHASNPSGGSGNSLKVELRGHKRGFWWDFGENIGGDPLDLVAQSKRLPIREAMRWAADFIGMAHDAPSPPMDRHAKPAAQRDPSKAALKLWSAGKPIAGTHAAEYLRARGISVDPGPWLRFVPGLDYWFAGARSDKPVSLGQWPALICGVTVWPATEPVAVHRTYLDRTLPRKAQIADPETGEILDPKKALGSTRNGAVRLGHAEPADLLFLAEGVETALSVLQAEPEAAVWAVLGTAGMVGVTLPPELRELVIVVDPDKAGRKAAKGLIDRVNADMPATEISVVTPSGGDLNDLLTRGTE